MTHHPRCGRIRLVSRLARITAQCLAALKSAPPYCSVITPITTMWPLGTADLLFPEDCALTFRSLPHIYWRGTPDVARHRELSKPFHFFIDVIFSGQKAKLKHLLTSRWIGHLEGWPIGSIYSSCGGRSFNSSEPRGLAVVI